ncbi:hypothetical protein GLYMA_08G229000v4 [Glycine max]|uniref:Uncharacterized protein n=1 Tax=Glycine max TaxID=3847 RepID=K7L891_SOYBN|nr:hypothetical protein GYH30_022114 [Glycine max]KRH44752.1 hypothetical protein GLYMA_08G229000v4 [Glycine max]
MSLTSLCAVFRLFEEFILLFSFPLFSKRLALYCVLRVDYSKEKNAQVTGLL